MKNVYIVTMLLVALIARVSAFSSLAADALLQKGYAAKNDAALSLFQNPASMSEEVRDLSIVVGVTQPYFIEALDLLVNASGSYRLPNYMGEASFGVELLTIAPVVETHIKGNYAYSFSFGLQVGARVDVKLFSLAEDETFTATSDAIFEAEYYISCGFITHINEGIRVGGYVENISFATPYYRIKEPLRVVLGSDLDIIAFPLIGDFNFSFAGIYARKKGDNNIDLSMTLRKDVVTGFSFMGGIALKNAGRGMNLSLGFEYATKMLRVGYAYVLPLTSMMIAGEHSVSLYLNL